MNFGFNGNNKLNKDENQPLVGNIEPPIQHDNNSMQNFDNTTTAQNGNVDTVNTVEKVQNTNVQNGENNAITASLSSDKSTESKNTNDAPIIQEQPIILETKEQIEYRETMEKIEHTNLSPAASVEDILTLCQDAITYNFNSICIHPVYLKTAYKFLKKSGKLLDVQLATVVGCPLGENLLKSKLTELKHVFKAKADIVDVYLNISAIKYLNRKDKAVKKQIKKFAKFTKIVKEKNRDKKKDRIVRIVLDTRYFNLHEMQHICQYCIRYNVPYITITEGITSTKLNLEEVQTLVNSLDGQIKVKLNYNIKNIAEFHNTGLKDISLFATKHGVEIANELKLKLNLQ